MWHGVWPMSYRSVYGPRDMGHGVRAMSYGLEGIGQELNPEVWIRSCGSWGMDQGL